MKFNIHAGHNPDGKVACGAVGLIKESTEARKIKDKVIKLLKSQGHTVYDCTVNDGKDQDDVLDKIVAKCNKHTVDLDVSIHFNSGVSDVNGNGKTTGTEVFIYSDKSKAKSAAKRVCDKIAALGFRNRGVKVNKGLRVLNSTNSPSMLIEVCFVKDKDDISIYKKNIDKIAEAIVSGLLGDNLSFSPFKVKVTANALNVRAGAGANYKVNTVIKRDEVYTITAESNGWGKLKSGAGWINLKYTQRV